MINPRDQMAQTLGQNERSDSLTGMMAMSAPKSGATQFFHRLDPGIVGSIAATNPLASHQAASTKRHLEVFTGR
jgi:hypothetical protein